jgi:carboxymethylenebutenolidase
VDVVTEHVDVEAADGVADSLFVHPAEGVHPVVVVYMDAYGIRPSLEALAERLASHGYAVFVPNVLYRDGRSPVAENLDEQMRAEDRAPLWAILGPKIRRLTPDVARADAKAWMAYVRSRTEVDPGPVGTVGYCMGGRLSLRMAGQFPDVVAAAASFHGGGLATEEPDSPHLAAVDAGGELYVGHADNDAGGHGAADPGAGRCARAPHRGAVRRRCARLDTGRHAGLRRAVGRAPLDADARAVRPRAVGLADLARGVPG